MRDVLDALHQIDWDEDEYETGEADETALAMEEPQHHERDPTKEVALDDKVFKMDEPKVLPEACAHKGLPTISIWG